VSIAKGTGYVQGSRRAAALKLASHIKYLEHRPRGADETREDRTIFSDQKDAVGRHQAIDGIMEHTSSAVNFHKLVLSPSKDEPVSDWQEWTRRVMRDLEEFKRQELHWYAVKHGNTDDPHVHIVLAGSGERFRDGRPRAVKMYAQDYAFLRERGREQSGYDSLQQDRELARQIDREPEHLEPYTRSASQTIERDVPRSRGIDR
jgi:hypothetical protein